MSLKKEYGVFSPYQLELTKKFYLKYQEECCRLMLMLIGKAQIKNLTKEDCIDMYNEFFVSAIHSYNPEKSRFKFYLKRIVWYKTIDFIRRVISRKDPLFYSSSMDQEFIENIPLYEMVGTNDPKIKNFDTILASGELRVRSLSDLDRQILYYRGLGFTLEEIGHLLNMSASGVRKRIMAQKGNKRLFNSLIKLD